MQPVVSYGARARGRLYDLAIYQDKRGYFLHVYDGRARDLVAPVHLDPRTHGQHPDGAPWSYPTWRAWLRDGAERLLFRVGILRLAIAPSPSVPADTEVPLAHAHTG